MASPLYALCYTLGSAGLARRWVWKELFLFWFSSSHKSVKALRVHEFNSVHWFIVAQFILGGFAF